MLFRKRNRDLDEELKAHLDMAARDCGALAARRELGNISLIQEVTRDMWGRRSLERLLQDLRYGLRVLRKNPGYAAVAVFSLALGIGVNTAIFSLINAVMLETLPVQNPGQLAIVGDPTRTGGVSQGSGIRTDLYSYAFFQQFRGRNPVFRDVYASGRSEHLNIALVAGGKSIPQTGRTVGRFVSGNYFSLLGVTAARGRTFSEQETHIPGAAPVAVLSYGYWERQFGRDESLLGRKLLVNGAPFTVVGIAARSFSGDIVGTPIDIWFPLTMQAQANPGYNYLGDLHTNWLLIMGRLKPGVGLARAAAAIDIFNRQLYRELYAANTPADQFRQLQKEKFPVSSGARGFSRIRHDFSAPLLVLMGVVAFVLLICCANIANLQLARAAARRREISLRLAIGAGRARLVRQLFTESLLLAAAGGLLGLLLSVWISRLLLRLVSQTDRVPLDVHLDARTFFFTAAVALLAGILFGLAPAWQSTRTDLVLRLRATRGTGESSAKFGRTLVVVQVALSMILLVGAGLFVRTLQNLKNMDLGYVRNGLVLAELDFKAAGYQGAAILQLAHRLLDSLAATPGVQGASVSENGLFSGTDSESDAKIEGYTPRTDADRGNHSDRVGPAYFRIVGTPVLAGRGITSQDVGNATKVAVINESMARFYFPHSDPIGRHITDPEGKPASYTIVGVVRDVKQSNLREPAPRRFYLSYFQPKETDPITTMNLEIRTAGDSAAVLNAVRQRISAVDPKIPILDLSSADKLVEDTLDEEQLVARLSSLFGALALVLAAIGLYGVMSYRTARRTGEIGIRMALGAGRRSVMAMVLGETCILVAVGIAAGMLSAVVLAALLQNMLFGLSRFEMLPMIVAAAVIAIAAVGASLAPAWKAARVDPTVALRCD